MKKFLQKTLFILFLLVINTVFSQTQKYLRKASAAAYSGRYEKARQYYLKALEKEPDNYKANYGIGIVLAEYLTNYESSLPYLEKALKFSPSKDSVPDIQFALGKVYAYSKQYNNALNYFEKVKQYKIDDEDFTRDLNKRISDCYYAKNHTDVVSTKKIFVVNAGSTINTDMDEYVPVLTPNNQLIYTSKRKDGIKEKVNPDNGKYYEAMYISDIKNGYTSKAKLFSKITSKSINENESIVSVFPDGKRIYLYKDKKLYEGDIDRTVKNPNVESGVINFDDYQNHACLTKDGQTLYFTSESESGNGGNDIYVSTKDADGNWGTPKNLGKIINTVRDEEAPFISADGKTLYFSSNGYSDCYGEFDIYKTTFENGSWGLPVNLGLPINSSANDIFYTIKEDESVAYFSSSRPKGLGELDIYKVNFPEKYTFGCGNTILALEAVPDKEDSFKYTIKMGVSSEMKDKIISFIFSIDDSLIAEKADDINYHFQQIKDYKLKAKLVAGCDTCVNAYIACAEQIITIKDTTRIIVASANSNNNTDIATIDNTNSSNKKHNKKKSNNNNNNNNNNNADVATAESANSSINKNGNTKSNNASNNATVVVKEGPIKGELTQEELTKIGLDFKPLYFSFDDDQLREDAKINMDHNIEILKQHPELKVVLNGHTDSRGGKRRNLYLSERRAITAKKYMISAGVSKRRITTAAKGEAFLINNCADESECDNAMHQLNRRVEVKVVK